MGLAKEIVTTQTHEKLCSDILFSHESVRFVGVVNNKSDLKQDGIESNIIFKNNELYYLKKY